MMQNLIEAWQRRRGARNAGAAAVELAIAAPLLILLVLGVVDYGGLMNTAAFLLGATRAGTEYAKANWDNPLVSNVATATEQQVCGFLGLTLSGGACPPVTPSVATACTCIDGTAVPCPSPTGSNPCAAFADPRVLVYVSATATQTFTPLFSVGSFTFPNPLGATTATRIQ